MKKLFTLIAALVLTINLTAQTNLTEADDFNATGSHGVGQYDRFFDEGVIVSPQRIHLYFHGCSPHGEPVTVTNNTSEELVINRCWAENFIIEFLYEGNNIANTGFIVPVMETVEFEVFASPTIKNEHDVNGTIFIDTDFGIYTIELYYETSYGIEEQEGTFSLSPVPAHSFLNITGENLGTISIYNTLGQLVEETTTESKETKIATAHYPNGIYFVRTAHGETKRFIIAH